MADRVYSEAEVIELASRKELTPEQREVVDEHALNNVRVKNADFAAKEAAKYNW